MKSSVMCHLSFLHQRWHLVRWQREDLSIILIGMCHISHFSPASWKHLWSMASPPSSSLLYLYASSAGICAMSLRVVLLTSWACSCLALCAMSELMKQIFIPFLSHKGDQMAFEGPQWYLCLYLTPEVSGILRQVQTYNHGSEDQWQLICYSFSQM